MDQYIRYAFYTLLSFKTLTSFYLNFRNTQYVLRHRDQVPENFKDMITLEEHQKAADYTIEKAIWGRVCYLVDLVLLLAWIGGGLSLLDETVRGFGIQNEILVGLSFFGLLSLISMIINMPMSLYSTFVIEEKFGFNKMTIKMYFIDSLKQMALGLVLGVPLLCLILWLMLKLESTWWIWAFVSMTSFQIILMWIYPTLLAPLFNKFTPLEEGELKGRIEGLLEKINLKFKGILVMDASKRSAHGNAYFTGFGANKRIVFFDTLLNQLSPSEAEAVLAHELGHFKHKHILKSIVISILGSLLAFYILGLLYHWQPFYQGHGVNHISSYMGLALFSMVSGVYTFWTTPIFTWLSRKNEFEADRFAAKYSSADQLIGSLIKLYKENASTLTPDPVFSAYYHSHPPASIRIKTLEKLGDT